MEKIYLLIGRVNGEVKYWRALSTRPKAEKMKQQFKEFDKVRGVTNWEYTIYEERID